VKINNYTAHNPQLFRKAAANNPIRQNKSLYDVKADMGVQPNKNHFDEVTLSSAEQLQGKTTSYTSQNFENILKSWIENAFSETGLATQDFETVEIGLDIDGRMTVSGLKNDNDNLKLAAALNKKSSTTSALTGGIGGDKDFSSGVSRLQAWTRRMFYRNSDWAKSAANEFERNNRAELIYIKNNASKSTEEYAGIVLDYSKLYRTEDGDIAGYPEELAWYFEAEIDMPNAYEPSKTTEKEKHALVIRNYANMLLDAGYDNIPDINSLDIIFKFTKSDFLFLD
jgi:hypothetical protein